MTPSVPAIGAWRPPSRGPACANVRAMPSSMTRRDLLALAVRCLIAVGIPLWLAVTAGTVGIPTDDDWVYMRGAENLFRTGVLDMPGPMAASIGQLVLVQPLLWLSGGDPWAFTAFGLVMGLLAAASTYLLARRFVGVGSAVLVSLIILAFPGFLRATASFMTDVPTHALALLCLLLGVRWLQGTAADSPRSHHSRSVCSR